MKWSAKMTVLALTAGEIALALLLFHLLGSVPSGTKYLAMAGVIALSLAADWLILRSSDNEPQARQPVSPSDYLREFRKFTGLFPAEAEQAIQQIDALQRRQQTLSSLTEVSSPIRSAGEDADRYILANFRRMLSRLMLYDATDTARRGQYVSALQEILSDNDRVLTDYENLIIEVSQLDAGADAASAPCLKELADALHNLHAPGQSGTQIQQ